MRLGITACALAPLLASCGGFSPDMSVIERHVERGIVKQTGASGVTVTCPESIDWKAGQDFHCIAKAQGQRYEVTVSMENSDGAYSWRVG